MDTALVNGLANVIENFTDYKALTDWAATKLKTDFDRYPATDETKNAIRRIYVSKLKELQAT